MRKLTFSILILLSLLVVVQQLRDHPKAESAASDEMRLVSLAPSLTALTFALGRGSQLVGVTTFCDDPPEALAIDKIGSFLSPNLEKILDLAPDLVLAEEWSSSRTVPRLRQLGVGVFEKPTPRSIQEIRNLIGELGARLHSQEQALSLLAVMDRQLAEVREEAGRYGWKPKVYLEIDIPSWTVGRASFTDEALRIAGFQNIFGDLSQPAPRVSAESIIERNPDIIVSFTATAEQIAARPGWQEITAVARNWIIDDFTEAWLSRGSHRLTEGMARFQQRVAHLPGWSREHR